MLLNRIAASVAAFFLLASTGVVAEPRHRGSLSISYVGRDGAAEARSDISSGQPLKLYRYSYVTRSPGYRVPGLECGGAPNFERHERLSFAPLYPADYGEGRNYNAIQVRQAHAAVRFATQYNQTVIRGHLAKFQQMCPGLQLTAIGSQSPWP
jgi:hypothetical protein